jgi:hypothetical protein
VRNSPALLLLAAITIALSGLLSACGVTDNSPSSTLHTFWHSHDLGGYESFASLAEGAGGRIIIGGLAHVEVVDPASPLPVDYVSNQATLLECRSNGDIVWSTLFGIEMYGETVVAVAPDPSGGYLAAVKQSYTGGPGSDFTLQPVDGDGVLGVGNSFNQDQWDDAYDIHRCGDGNFILSGRQGNMGPPRDEANIVKFDPSGATIWQRTFSRPDAHLKAEQITELPDNTLLVASIFNPADGSGTDLHVMRLSAAGDSLYGVVVPIEGNIGIEDIAATSDGGYKVLLGLESDQYACAVVWMTNLGDLSSIQYTFDSSYFGIGDGAFTPDGGAVLCGYFEPEPDLVAGLLMKLDASGVIAWEREFVDPDASVYFLSVLDHSGGGYVVAGSRELHLDGSRESLLLRSDEEGNVSGAP